MSDVDKDTMLSATEFAIAFHLILCLRSLCHCRCHLFLVLSD
jgi:hypothetical protein